MAYSKEVFTAAKDKLNFRRMSALNIADERKRSVYLKIPRLEQIEVELSSIGVSTAKAVIKGSDAVSLLNSLKEESIKLQQEYAKLLSDNGYTTDYLDVDYFCKKCNDSGYVEGDNCTVMCDCFKKLLSDTACEMLNSISPLSLSTFDTFNLNYYSNEEDINGKVPYNRMVKIFNYCCDYAATFGLQSKSILMRGATGLGKTHLSLAIANEVIRRGFSVVYVSAPDILSRLEKEHFSYNYDKERETLKSLTDCDLLIIDDLGTEFSTQFTSAAVYNLFNSRILLSKPIIINTNMTIHELESAYSQRFVSRLIGSCDRLDFIGSDIRARL